MDNLKYIFLIIILTVSVCSCRDEEENTLFVTEEEQSIGDYLEENKDTYSIFYQVIQRAGLFEALHLYNSYGNRDFTLFLPGDNSISNYLSETEYNSVEDLLADSLKVQSFAKMHIVASGFVSNEFPYGRLGDSTFTGDYIYIGLDEEQNYKLNNNVDVVEVDIELSNGIVHIIDGVLEPITATSIEYLKNRNQYSLITRLFEITGLSDTLDKIITTSNGAEIANRYTLMVETDEAFASQGIQNIDSLIKKYGDIDLPYTDQNNGLYQYAAYHVLEGNYAINDFKDVQPYVTYANNPMTIDATRDIIINKGLPVYDTIVIAGDSVALNYIRVDLYESNGFSKNGPIHTLKDPLLIMEPKGNYEFQFENEPKILEAKNDATISEVEFNDPSELIYISWSGAESIYYYSNISGPKNNDCLYAFGSFGIEYETPNVAAGSYEIVLRLNISAESPQIKLFIDDIQQQSIIDLAQGKNGFRSVKFGTRRFEEFGSHQIRIETVVGGELYWDWIQFRPLQEDK